MQWDEAQKSNFVVISSKSAADYSSQVSQTQRKESVRRVRMKKYHTALRNLKSLEADLAELGYDVPWAKTNPKYKVAVEYSKT